MNERILALADRALREDLFLPPYRSEINHDYDSLPEPMRIACHIRDHFGKIPVRKIKGELLTDAFRIDGFPVPGCAYRHTSHHSWGSFFHVHSDYQPCQLAFVDWNHYCNNYRFIVHHGFIGYLDRIAESRIVHKDNPDKLVFLDALETVCKSIGELCERYQTRVPYYPSETFAEAVEAVWFSFLLLPDSLGRLDDVLYPFYRREIDSGKLTEAIAEEYIGELLVKVFAHIGKNAHRSGDNTMVVGGYTADGSDGFTDLSALILRTRASLPIWRPQISFRYTDKTSAEVMRFVTEMNAKCSDIVFTNDETFLKAFDRLGFDRKDSVDYTKIGCNEWAIMGKSHTGSDGFFNTVAALEELLYFNPDRIAKITDFDTFMNVFRDFLGQKITFMCDLADKFYEANAGDTNILTSLMLEGGIEKAESVTRGGAKYNASCWSAVGLINLADSLSIIKQFVFDEKCLTLPEFCEILKNNWQGADSLRADMKSRGRYFGNNDSYVDSIVNLLIDMLDGLANRRKPKKGGRYLFGCYIGYNSAHISMGLRTRATPDGRYDGDPFTAGINAGSGRDKSGLTAYLMSAAKLNYTVLAAPLAVNLRLDRSLTSQTDKLSALYATYLHMGGLQLQPDYLSADDLLDAQIHPECWRSLRVRITGFTGFFTQFGRDAQNEVIARTEHR